MESYSFSTRFLRPLEHHTFNQIGCRVDFNAIGASDSSYNQHSHVNASKRKHHDSYACCCSAAAATTLAYAAAAATLASTATATILVSAAAAAVNSASVQ
eukprot:GHVT01031918.1.p2 GENE.GHVT01031918.1~~GHVT01031918.1.p2  ORF type:complete len:100 (+),score=12.48 GHVT01031918.1:1703-2002(+)